MTRDEYLTHCTENNLVPMSMEFWSDDVTSGETACCCHCGQCLDTEIDARHPEPANYYHEDCQAKADRDNEIGSLQSEVESLCKQHGWSVGMCDTGRPGSWYTTVRKGERTLKIRVADHSSCYCSEDISLVTPSGSVGGDDHTIEILVKKLQG